jgi:hypothetical protein
MLAEMLVLDGPRPLNRRRSDRDGRDAERRDRRRIAEEAFRLFVERGYDRREIDECWCLAELRVKQALEEPRQ